MKIKVPSGGGGIKTFLANHVEKIVFGFVTLLSLILIISGIGSSSVIEGTQSPSDLQNVGSQTRSHLESFTWENDYKPQRDLPQRYSERVDGLSQKVDASGYKLSQYLKPPYTPPRRQRQDPELLPPESLRLISGRGVLAVKRSAAGIVPSDKFVPDSEAERNTDEGFISVDAEQKARGVYFVSVTAVVPMKKQLQLYIDALGSSDEYNLERDQPVLLGFVMERADVTADPAAAPKWEPIANSNKMEQVRNNEWAGSVTPTTPFVGPKYEDPKITGPIPPIRGAGGLDVWENLARHPLIPVFVDPSAQPTETPAGDAPAKDEPAGIMTPFGEPTTPGSGSGTPIAEGTRSPETLAAANSGPAADRAKLVESTPEYKLFRYFDTDVQPGHVYRYRIQLFYMDPNNPKENKPSSAAMESSVASRIAALKPGTHWRNSEFSEPSIPLSIGASHDVLAGTVEWPDAVIARGTTESFYPALREVVAKVVGMEFDLSGAIKKAALLSVSRGGVLNGDKDVIVVMPLTGASGTIEGSKVRTNAVVVDIRGGEAIGDTKLTEPGRILFWNADGSFGVGDELRDAGQIDNLRFTDEEEAKAAAAAAREKKKEAEKKERGNRDRGQRGLPTAEGREDS